MYGDDCANATNYPIVRLRDTHTNAIYYCRTYDFSTLGVATGASLQSARFSTAGVPYGDYDLCVIANGISSHCISFCHERPSRSCCHEAKQCGSCGCRRSCCADDRQADPEVVGLRNQVRRMQNSMDRLTAVVGGESGLAQPKETHEQEAEAKPE